MNQRLQAKGGKLKRYRETIQTKQDIPKPRKKSLSTTGRASHKNVPTIGCQRNPTILD